MSQLPEVFHIPFLSHQPTVPSFLLSQTLSLPHTVPLTASLTLARSLLTPTHSLAISLKLYHTLSFFGLKLGSQIFQMARLATYIVLA